MQIYCCSVTTVSLDERYVSRGRRREEHTGGHGTLTHADLREESRGPVLWKPGSIPGHTQAALVQ